MPVVVALVMPPLLAAALAILRLALLRRLVHRIQDAEIMLRMLEIRLGHHAVAAAGRVATKLEVFLRELLRGAADADVRTAAVEDVVAVERDAATAGMVPDWSATATAAAGTMTTPTHTLYVHSDCRHMFPLSVLAAKSGAAGLSPLMRVPG